MAEVGFLSPLHTGTGRDNGRSSIPTRITPKVPFRDLSIVDETLLAELLAAVERVLRHGRLLFGPEVDAFESHVAADCGRRFCVGLGSGTDALFLALKSLGIGPGDEVITTPLSWIATLNAIHLTGATPVFADIRGDLNIDPARIAEAITPRTRAIVPVHFNGRLCDMAEIGAIAERQGLLVVEDAAQAYGANVGGRAAGSFGAAAAFSFNPMKVLPGFGEAGAVVTDDADQRDRLVALRYLGTEDREICRWPALNAKIDTLQAAMLLVSRRHYEKGMAGRHAIARAYVGALAGVVACPEVAEGPDRPSVFFDFQIQTERRDALQRFLADRGIETKIRYGRLMPDHPAYASLKRPSLPVAEALTKRILCFPIHDRMTESDTAYVVDGVKAFFRG